MSGMKKSVASELSLPAVRLGLAFFAGLIYAYYCGEVTRLVLVAICVPAAVICCLRSERLRLSAVGLLLGVSSMTAYISLYCEPVYAMAGQTVTARCYVTEIRRYSGGYKEYAAYTVLDGRPAAVLLSGDDSAGIGDTVTVTMELSKVRESTYYFSDGILLRGYVSEIHSVKRGRFSVLRSMSELRGSLEGMVCAGLGGDEEALARAMIFGDDSFIGLKLESDIQRSGVSYMTVVSGAHFTVCVMLLTELLNRRWRLAAAVMSVAAVPFLVLFYGMTPTVIRAGIMLLIYRGAVLFRRRAVTLNSLCAALLMMTVLTPWAAVDPGLQMSALGVFGVGVVGVRLCGEITLRAEKKHKWVTWVKTAVILPLCAVVCTAPISISLFGGISLAGVFASAVLTPLFTAAIGIGLLSCLTGGELLKIPLGIVMHLMRGIIGFFGGIPGVWLPQDFDAAPFLATVCALSLTAAAFYGIRAARPVLYLFAVTSAVSVLISVFMCETREELVFVSNGTSGAAAVLTGRSAMIVISGGGNALSKELCGCLTKSGIYTVKAVVAPELDNNGTSTLRSLYEIFGIESIYAPESRRRELERLCGGSSILSGEVSVSVRGMSIACAKAGDTSVQADIVLYYGYKMSVPEHSAKLPLYVSSRQNYLPEGGINVYDTDLKIPLDDIGEERLIICQN